MEVGDLLATVLPVGVVAVHVGGHGPRSVQGDQGGHVVEGGRGERAHERPHRAALELEDAHRVAPAQHGEGRRGRRGGCCRCPGALPVDTSMRSRARSMTERLRSPRKSILSSPRSSTPCISYWVTTGASSGLLPSGLRWTGTYSVRGSSVMTTAAAWMPSWRRRPSRPLATSMTFLASGSVSYMVAQLAGGGEPVLVSLGAVEAGGQRGVPTHEQGRHGLGDLVTDDVGVSRVPGRRRARRPGP